TICRAKTCIITPRRSRRKVVVDEALPLHGQSFYSRTVAARGARARLRARGHAVRSEGAEVVGLSRALSVRQSAGAGRRYADDVRVGRDHSVPARALRGGPLAAAAQLEALRRVPVVAAFRRVDADAAGRADGRAPVPAARGSARPGQARGGEAGVPSLREGAERKAHRARLHR